MELSEPEKSKNSDNSGVQLVDTSDSDDKGKLGFSWDVNLSSEFGLNRTKCTFLLAVISAAQSFS
jgi:hypothetical protein